MEYTEKQFREFDRLSHMSSSPDQVERIEGRLGLYRMMEELGADVCDAMWRRCVAEDLAKVKKKVKK